MESALREYYGNRDPLGRDGDFITAPEISQIFGEIIGIWLVTEWQKIAASGVQPTILAELGAGRGTLMSDILRTTRNIPDFHDNIEIHLVEINEHFRRMQKSALAGYNLPIFWHESIDTIPQKPLLLVANEFFDALPIHQYIMTENGWCERMVNLNGNKPEFTLSGQPNSSISKEGEIGDIYEHCPQAIDIVKKIVNRVKDNNGAALIIDYGYFEDKHIDSLQAVKNHKYHHPLETPGETDITAHVDFNVLVNAAKEAGIPVYGTTQGEFLRNMGAEIRAASLIQNATPKQTTAIKQAIERLISPDQMGSLFKVIALPSPKDGSSLPAGWM